MESLGIYTAKTFKTKSRLLPRMNHRKHLTYTLTSIKLTNIKNRAVIVITVPTVIPKF